MVSVFKCGTNRETMATAQTSEEKKTANSRAHKHATLGLLSTWSLVVAVVQRKTEVDLLWLIAAIAMKHGVVKKDGHELARTYRECMCVKVWRMANNENKMLYKTHTHTLLPDCWIVVFLLSVFVVDVGVEVLLSHITYLSSLTFL